ncbi:MAG: endonuclease MutS2 [Anaerolineae bacterium]|nr:endonuclease MutS2 [Anaerolineae bacterium]
MNSKYLQILELPKILERLAERTSFSAGRKLALSLQPSPDGDEVAKRQGETSEARALLDARADLSVGGARDVRPLVDRAEHGAILLPSELLDVRDTLVSGRTLRRAITRLRNQFPLLASAAGRIEECPNVVAEIARCINDRAEVVDRASQNLARVRRELREAHQRLMAKLERIVSSASNAPFLQEAFVTQRSGRYVIPLKTDFKGRIPGIVHDQSASGATIFIEPLSTVELNNRWRELQLEEEREVQRILAGLSNLVAEEGELIKRTVEVLAKLDLAFAKARYAEEIEGVEPKLVAFRKVAGGLHPGSSIQLIKARHPLLDPATAVPIDVHLDDDYFIIVITGPNTGGKTVSLKTVGLLSLMAQCGLAIPAAEGSALSVFSDIYADIGDEQSIEQSLSTFSAHITNVINILDRAEEHSLVLLDDLGAGTDPGEGSAIARALLSHFLRRRITAFISTHYPELKFYAHTTPGVENACVEFDLETLSPTYELSIGLPGHSNAFAIARRLGLSPEIVGEAQSLVSPESLETEGLLAEIKQAHREALASQEAAEAARDRVEDLQGELRQELGDIERTRREILSTAREEALQKLEEVRVELRKIRTGLGLAAISQEWVAQAEDRLASLEPEPVEPVVQPRFMPQKPLSRGDTVWVAGLQATGEITELAGDEAEVQVGAFRIRAEVGDLELRHKAAQPEVRERAVSVPRVSSPGLELNLRGQTVEEVLPRLDKYLNDAYLAGLPQVRIIHGKGTGALRRAVRDFVADHPLVASHRSGDRYEGGEGATVVKLMPR